MNLQCTKCNFGQTNLISGSTDFLKNLKGWWVGKRRKLALNINKNFLCKANPASVAIFESSYLESVSV